MNKPLLLLTLLMTTDLLVGLTVQGPNLNGEANPLMIALVNLNPCLAWGAKLVISVGGLSLLCIVRNKYPKYQDLIRNLAVFACGWYSLVVIAQLVYLLGF